MFNYVLETPIQPKDAKHRGLRKDIAKLLVMTDREAVERESSLNGLSERVYATRKEGEIIHALPISSFIPVENYEELLSGRNMAYYLDIDLDNKKKRPQALLMECDTKENCLFVLTNIDSEAILFYSARKIVNNNVSESEKRLLEASVFGYDEKIFLKELEAYGFFTFFAESHMSLEILGMESPVISCLTKFLKLENRLPETG